MNVNSPCFISFLECSVLSPRVVLSSGEMFCNSSKSFPFILVWPFFFFGQCYLHMMALGTEVWIISSSNTYVFLNKYFLSPHHVPNRNWKKERVLQTEEFAGGSLHKCLEHSSEAFWSLFCAVLWDHTCDLYPLRANGQLATSTWLPGSCCYKNLCATSHPGVSTGFSVMSVTLTIDLGGWISGIFATTCYISSPTHPWRLVRSLWLWMRLSPFLLYVRLAHVEYTTNTEGKFLPTQLVIARGRDKMSCRCWRGCLSLPCLQGFTDISWLNPVTWTLDTVAHGPAASEWSRSLLEMQSPRPLPEPLHKTLHFDQIPWRPPVH